MGLEFTLLFAAATALAIAATGIAASLHLRRLAIPALRDRKSRRAPHARALLAAALVEGATLLALPLPFLILPG